MLHHFFEAIEIDDAGRWKAILLSSVGSQTYSLMRNLVSPAKPGDKSFEELVKLLKDHFNPRPSEMCSVSSLIPETENMEKQLWNMLLF